MQMMFYFKKHNAVYKTKSKIVVKRRGKGLKINLNDSNIKLLRKIISEGIEVDEIEKTELYKNLYDNDFLYKNSDFEVKAKINRNNLFLNHVDNNITNSEIEILKKTNILIYGVGGVGSPLIYLLAQFGYKNLTVIDFDKVENSDIQRVMTYDKDDLGKLKTKALKDKINRVFSIKINCFEGTYSKKNEVEEIIKKVKPDFIVNACDPKPAFRLHLNEICFKYKIPYINLSYAYEYLLIGPIYVPTITSCANSFNINIKKKYGNDEGYENVEKLFHDFLVHPSNSFNINIIASLAFKEILFFTLGKFAFCQTIGREISFNTLTYETTSTNALCEKECDTCSEKKIK